MDDLSTWNAGAAKKSLIEFIKLTTTSGSRDLLPPADRIAVFGESDSEHLKAS